jgi:hypothetical protein
MQKRLKSQINSIRNELGTTQAGDARDGMRSAMEQKDGMINAMEQLCEVFERNGAISKFIPDHYCHLHI